jgi:DNA-directed RNA polymerase subunit beta'
VYKYAGEKTLVPNFKSIRISLASPEKIKAWSHGHVTKPETINYRTFKPERDGLFCARIFGPVTDWECLCGKYKRMKHRGVVCDKCGVEVTQAKVRRERLGHIELASPCSHVWFFKGLPSRIGHLLDIPLRELEKVLYFENYIVIADAKEIAELGLPLKEREMVTDERYRQLKTEFPGKFTDEVARMGAEAIKYLLQRVEIDELAEELRHKMKNETSQQKKLKFSKRLKVVDSFRKSGNQPNWMILDVIPVIPPELRPLVPLDGGRFATSDLNDLYRRVINRNNRLSKLIELKAPEVIVRNEKRMLQEAVDALFDNGRRGRVLRGVNNRPLKSLSDTLKGKQGRFRQNLLGKRVDYSGRSVIVVGPELKLHQCGLPKKMALELFKPFIYNRLEAEGHAATIKQAKELVEDQDEVVWDILEKVIKDHPVLLNRAPTLHRLGIQAFEPVLVEGKAIKLHPLTCTAFNADFDGDQMAVHVPLSPEAQIEATVLMLSSNNILSPASGQPIAVPSQDIVLGCYYLTRALEGTKGEGRAFATMDEVLLALDAKAVTTQTKIRLRYTGRLIDLDTERDNQDIIKAQVKDVDRTINTSVGRVIFNQALPKEMPYINGMLKKKGLTSLVNYCFLRLGHAITVAALDSLKALGFYYATRAGLSIGIDDMVTPPDKKALVKSADDEVIKVEEQYKEGVITNGERYNKIVAIWSEMTEKVADEMFKEMGRKEKESRTLNPILVMADSGARGNNQQIRQLAGMRGLMAKPSGEIIETPIRANFREGLDVLQYFISTHGARKGLADTALKTADSGYLTRRLVDVAQDVIISEPDCGTIKGIWAEAIIEAGDIVEGLRERIIGRVALEDVIDPITSEILARANEAINEDTATEIQNAGIERLRIRSVLTCESRRGCCILCYGRNLGTGQKVDIGEAVGVIAAQSIGEPGTQLTMRTFHIGGTASRVAEQSSHEARLPGAVKYDNLNTVTNREGKIVAMNRNGSVLVVDDRGREVDRFPIAYGATINFKDHERVEEGQKIAEWDPYTNAILTEVGGHVHWRDLIEGVTVHEEVDEVTGLTRPIVMDSPDDKRQPRIEIRTETGKVLKSYTMPIRANLMVNNNDAVEPGDVIAKIPREASRTKDIVGGLPRVVELFEARKPKEQAIMSEIDGIIKFGNVTKGSQKISVVSETGDEREYSVPRGTHINVQEGDRVRAGEPLMDGPLNPHDILAVQGMEALQRYLVNAIQEVYRLQGVHINDKHIEVIVRQMLRWVRIKDVGDTEFLLEEQVDRFRFADENARVEAEDGQQATAEPLLLGITKASLSTESFISAASFQETTRVLTEAAISGRTDYLRGLKENVIMGRLIPAGTGMEYYRNVKVLHDPTMQDTKAEEVDDTQSYIEQMVAATAGRAVPVVEEEFEADVEENEEDSFLGEEQELPEINEEEFAFDIKDDDIE